MNNMKWKKSGKSGKVGNMEVQATRDRPLSKLSAGSQPRLKLKFRLWLIKFVLKVFKKGEINKTKKTA